MPSCTRMMRLVLRGLIGFTVLLLVVVLVLALFAVAPVHRYPIQQQPFFRQANAQLDSLAGLSPKVAVHGFKVGFSRQSLTPAYPTSTAGHGNRGRQLFSSVHDSLFVRTVVIDNGADKVAMIAVDLLLMPPSVRERVEHNVAALGFEPRQLYYAGTHTHNGAGNWGHGAIGFLYGFYDEALVEFMADQIVMSLREADRHKRPSRILHGRQPVPGVVENRMVNDTTSVDRLLRMMVIEQHTGERLALASFTAHPTCLSSTVLELSRDYPGLVVDELEKSGYDFAMFLAGGVASHAPRSPRQNWEKMEDLAQALVRSAATMNWQPVTDSTVAVVRFPLPMPDPQLKIAQDWRVRPWVFRAAFGREPVYLSAARIGNLVWLGTPCDFSGQLVQQLDSLQAAHPLIVTSFNGGYTGYITPDKYYDVDHYETRLMNWYGPGNGEYFVHCLNRLTAAVVRDPR
jgi:neutral ceramidase